MSAGFESLTFNVKDGFLGEYPRSARLERKLAQNAVKDVIRFAYLFQYPPPPGRKVS